MAQDYSSQNIGNDPETANPFTLREAVQNHNSGRRRWDYTVAEFFDMYYKATEPEQRAAMLADEPDMPLKWETNTPALGSHVYLGGVAEWLANQAGIPAPKWTFDPSRYYPEPYYPYNAGTPLTEEQKTFYRESTLPELSVRNYFVNSRLHERSFRWILAFDPLNTELRRQMHIKLETDDRRPYRLLWPMIDSDDVPKAEQELRRKILGECIRPPGRRLEDVLAANNVTAEELKLDLSPVKPGPFMLPAKRKSPKVA